MASQSGSKSLSAAKVGQRSAPDVPALSVSRTATPFHSMIAATEIFDDDFESGDMTAWSNY